MNAVNLATGKQPPLDSNEMALDRTWLAHERTLMAWVRTATSMISFGFTVDKFFEYEAGRNWHSHGLLTPRDFALIMIGVGLFSLLFATIARRRETRALSTELRRRPTSLAEFVAALICAFGMLAFLTTLFRH